MVVAGPEVPSEADRKPSPTVKTLKKVQFGRSAYADPSQVGIKQAHDRPVQAGPNTVGRTELAPSCDVNAKLADHVTTKEAEPKIVKHDEDHRYAKGIYRVASVNASDPRCELDSHADTCVAGSNTLRVTDEGHEVTVHGYSDELAPMIAQVTMVATLWIHPETG